MSFTNVDPSSHQGDNCWFTPYHIVDSLGPFDMDVCTMSFRPFDIADKHIEHDKGIDSLSTDWKDFIWMNPPYGKEINPFIEKFKQHNNGIALVFARMGTPWMQAWLKYGGSVFFLRKRIHFINREGKRSSANAGTDSCLLLAGADAIDRVKKSNMEGVLKL